MNADWRSRYNLAVEIARQAGDHAKHIYEASFHARDLNVITKSDDSPVTIADRGAEQLMRSAITKHFPKDGFLGEEYGDQPGSSGYRWIIDPIDGTKSFIRHIPLWGTLLGLEYQGELIAGVVYIPMFGQVYRALRGDGAYLDDCRIRVSTVSDISKATLCYSSLEWFRKAGKLDMFLNLYQRTGRQRGFGDFYPFMLIAQGSCELMVDQGLHPWDIAALVPIVEEAGGKFTNWTGVTSIHHMDVLGSNGLLHVEAIASLTSQ